MYANSAKFSRRPVARNVVTARDKKIDIACKMLNAIDDLREWEAVSAMIRREDSRLSFSMVVY